MQNLKTDKEFKNLISPISEGEFEQLKKSILEEGCRDALVVWNSTILDGHNRYKICTGHSISFKVQEKSFSDRHDAKVWIIQNQFGRRNLSLYDRAVLALKLEDVFRAKAKEKQREAGGALPQKSAKAVVDTRKELAKIAGVSHDTIGKVKYIEERASDEQQQAIQEYRQSINHVYKEIQREEIKKNFKPSQFPKRKNRYQIIYADPPYQYWEGGHKNQSQRYKTMSVQEICNLPVKDICEDNCILFLWVTYPALKEGLQVMESWAFRYSTVGFVWVKQNKNNKNFFLGCGSWTRANTELCLIGIKGRIERKDATVSQLIIAPREEHSKKPDIVRNKIIQLVGDLPRIELFARRKTKGWNIWGDEVGDG